MRSLWHRIAVHLFSPIDEAGSATTHAMCVSAREHAALLDRVRELEAQLQTHRVQVLGAEDRMKNIEARAIEYGQMYARLQRAAFPVSYLLTEGSCEEAMAINARLWELVRVREEQA